ncbi:[NiFe]-hydrogenase assembly chaperone HybE [Halomonas sp. LR5S13]|uniref:[NiFe]-hydrogenase assembly chaperone HybE n=1 Tax=Halomonas rhizosphaerae TaxID=3043296 RepID=UPI0024A83077|nr:[NiFe]-hydrogenase assembly chaperone HybE [Halomonas rhizosphaerae]MDI5920482.1 [NiFe]-hydrogenase assembly chaperone HybE [Halomonas rhizosphaerae]
MQALTVDQYARLRQLAEAWSRHHLKAAKRDPRFNPRLGVDALCFQPHSLKDGRSGLLGALVTPVSLSLALVLDEPAAPPKTEHLVLALPSGRYPFVLESLGEADWWWRCKLLEDLSDVGSLQEGSRLAQQLMERVMTPAAPNP